MRKLLLATALLMAVTTTADAQTLVSENVFKDITLLKRVRDNFKRPSPAGSKRKAGKPVAFYIGDSTMRTLTSGDGWNGQWGFGMYAQEFFDANQLVVENHALGGTSSVTYYANEWPAVKAEYLKDMTTPKLDIDRTGETHHTFEVGGKELGCLESADEQREVIQMQATNRNELVYSYGWYIHYFLNDIKAKGAIGVLINEEGVTPQQVVDWNSTLASRHGIELRQTGIDTSVGSLKHESAADAPTYTLTGQRSARAYRGRLFIRQGRVIFQ